MRCPRATSGASTTSTVALPSTASSFQGRCRPRRDRITSSALMCRWGLLSLVAVAACGRIAFEGVGSGTGDDGNDTDSSQAAPCTQWGPFGAPTPVTEVND